MLAKAKPILIVVAVLVVSLGVIHAVAPAGLKARLGLN